MMWVGSALADSHGDHGGPGDHDAMMNEMADMERVNGTGTINAIDAAARTVNLNHDLIMARHRR
jgi:Cu/Ag efflux protein CusF